MVLAVATGCLSGGGTNDGGCQGNIAENRPIITQQITPDVTITEFPIPTDSLGGPNGIAARAAGCAGTCLLAEASSRARGQAHTGCGGCCATRVRQNALPLVSLTRPERNPRSRCESVVPF